MAHYIRSMEGFDSRRIISIKKAENVENYTVYNIDVYIGLHKWSVKHRYSEFHELHEKLVSQYKINKNLLPPKKIFGKQSENFIRKRQAELELYLQNMLTHFTDVPACLSQFLCFKEYEIHGIAQELAEELFHKGDMILEAGEVFHISPLQLHAISRRLTLPEPTCDAGDMKKDLGHVLDFITRVKYLKIQGSSKPVGTSNIIPNQLSFDLSCFKSLQSLQISDCTAERLEGVENMKGTLHALRVQHSIKSIKEVLLLGVGVGQWHGNESILVPAWANLTSADLSHNGILIIDESVKLLPKLEFIDLSHNSLSSLEHLHLLSWLRHVDVSYNSIRSLKMLHTKLGNITTLNLAGNKIEVLDGFTKLYSLVTLNLSHNEVSQVTEVRHLSSLPCLEDLFLTGNPVNIVLDYRTKVLETFGDRAKEVKLDGQRPTQKELDTVAILIALQKAKEGRATRHKTARVPSIAEADREEEKSTVSQQTHAPLGAAGLTVEGEQYRHQVERLRVEGGAAWLSLLNQVNSRDSSREPSPNARQTPPPPRKSSPKDEEKKQKKKKKQRNSSVPPDDTALIPGYQPSVMRVPCESPPFMLPETLPGPNDSTFLQQLQLLTPDASSLTQLTGLEQRDEHSVHVLWCPVLHYIRPHQQLMACVYITTENIHLLKVNSLSSAFGFPDIEHLSCIPLRNVKQIVLGHESQYVRIEEACMGPQGTFTLLTGSTAKTNLFIDSLKLAYRRATSDLDQYEDPHIVVNGETDINLRTTLRKNEDAVLYALVQSPDHSHPEAPFMPFSLVVTKQHVNLLREDYVLWPQPTYAVGPSMRPQFELVAAFPVMAKISRIQMYDSDSLGSDHETTMNFSHSARALSPRFVGFGVRLAFDLGGHGTQELDLRVSTSGARDRILGTLTQVRKERSPAKQKARRSRGPQVVPPVEASDSSESDVILPPRQSPAGESSDSQGSEPLPVIRRSSPPRSLDVNAYPSMHLLEQLSASNEAMSLRQNLSEPMRNLAQMTGEELLNFFHGHIARIGVEAEEVRHLLWASVIPYATPLSELASCVLLTNRALYFISDRSPRTQRPLPPHVLRSHTRHRSDSYKVIRHVGSSPDDQLMTSSGILHRRAPSCTERVLMAYKILLLEDIKEVHMGFFDHALRLTGGCPDNVLSLVIRDSSSTEAFVKQLMESLSTIKVTPSPDVPVEQDFYSRFNSYQRMESSEFTHPSSKVTFVYPTDDAISELTYIVVNSSKGMKPKSDQASLLLYLLVFHVEGSERMARTLVVTDECVAIVTEDHVSYPLPAFTKSIPEQTQFEVHDVRNLESLKRIEQNSSLHKVVLVFTSASDESVVVEDHFSRPQPEPECEREWRLEIQCGRDSERLTKVLSAQWAEMHGDRVLPCVTC